MNKEEILTIIETLSKSQGFYGRLLEQLTDLDLEYLERKNFKNVIELIDFLEIGEEDEKTT